MKLKLSVLTKCLSSKLVFSNKNVQTSVIIPNTIRDVGSKVILLHVCALNLSSLEGMQRKTHLDPN